MSAPRPVGLTAERLLAGYAPEVRDLAQRLREWVGARVPGAAERVYPGWRAIGYHDGQAGYFCGIFPRRDHVRLLLEHGAALPDPAGLLEGDGRQTRYVPLRPLDPLPEAALADLLQEALRYGSTRTSRDPAARRRSIRQPPGKTGNATLPK